ncbi:hypothetical protein H5410_016085 [Solanum commersonii]|uniref:Uncharacterized protein n=1 Tax=Solanum commersonii TaxID=4109 RepID=A0A9J5ZV99_SOLCO|nr:hypothetical protein H5410_016085 [Solanum commersonii]
MIFKEYVLELFNKLEKFNTLAVDNFEISNLEEQNAERIEDSLEDIESNMNVVVPFIPQLGDQELREPYIGMKFQSLDIGFKFYLDYAYCNGFSVRKN